MCVEGAVKCNINLISHELNSRSQNILRSLGIPINCKMGKIQDFLCITILFWVSCRFFRSPEELHQALLGELRSGHETWIIGYPIANGQHICHICDVLWWSRMIYDDVLDSGTWFLFPLPCSSRGVWWLLPESKNWQWGQFGVSGTLGCNNQETRGAWGLGQNWGPELETHTVWLC